MMTRQRLILLLPLAVFATIGVVFFLGLGRDAQTLPSALLKKPLPDFALVDMPEMGPAFSPADLGGQVSLVNVFGSWCTACRVEHPLLMEIAQSGEVPIYGINWADTPDRGAAWLKRFGNPYTKVGNDEAGKAVISMGVTGAPETFLVDQQGRVRYRLAGPLTQETWNRTVKPMIEQVRAEQSS